MVEDDFLICFLNDIAPSDLSVQFELRKRGFLLSTLSKTIISQRYSKSVKRVSNALKVCIY